METYFKRVVPILNSVSTLWEIICIDDGSKDSTLTMLKQKSALEPKIKVISFTRNFGKEAALTAGLLHASGDAVIPIDADLQDPPELIPQMVAQWLNGYDVVLAVRSKRNDSFIKNLISDFYHVLISKLTNGQIPPRVGDFRLMDKKVVDVVNLLSEKSRYMKGIFSWVGFNKTYVNYERPSRKEGEATQSFAKLWKLALDGIFSFSSIPLKVWMYLGIGISGLSFLYALYIILKTIILGVDLPGYASLMVAVLFMGGINLLSLGILGEYVARIYKEVKNRPLFLIREEHGFKTKARAQGKQAKSKGKGQVAVQAKISV